MTSNERRILVGIVQTTMHLNEAIEEICGDGNEEAKLKLALATDSINNILSIMKSEWDL